MKPKKPTRKDRIVAFLADKDGWLTARQIADGMGEPISGVSPACTALAWDCRIKTDGGGRYARKHADIVPSNETEGIALEGESSMSVHSINESK